MSVRIRLEAVDTTDLDAHEAALRRVLTVPGCASGDYPNRRTGRGGGQPARRRYLDSTGVQPTPTTNPGRSPLAAAEDAKRRRDLAGELGILLATDRQLAAQPWAPIVPGDVVLMFMPADGDIPAIGQTFLAIDERDALDTGGHAPLQPVSATAVLAGVSDPDERYSFTDLWFEAGPTGLVVIRAGTVVHGTPTQAVTR